MTIYNEQVSRYIVEQFAQVDPALQQMYDENPKLGLPPISVTPEEGRFLQFLVRANGAALALEIGTLGGYSGTWIARGLAPGGRLITLEREPRHAEVARANFAAAGVAEQVELRLGDAHQLLQGLAAEGPFDFIFVDAEKDAYPAYLDWALENTRLGGVIAFHNAFRKGAVLGFVEQDEHTDLMVNFNRRVAQEPRLLTTIYPAGDGMLVSVKLR